MTRYSLQELVEASRLSEAALVRKVRMSGTALKNARAHGLRVEAADTYAVRAGLHPAEVWADWGTSVDGPDVDTFRDLSKTTTCGECGVRFTPTPRQRWCSKRCRNLASSRAWKQRNPEANRQMRRAYYEAHGDYERARQRRYHASKRNQEAA